MFPLVLSQSFAQEVVLWSHVNHPNILPFYGVHVALERQNTLARIALLSPWMEHGNAIEYVKANPHVDRELLVCHHVIWSNGKCSNHILVASGHSARAGLSSLVQPSDRARGSERGQDLFPDPRVGVDILSLRIIFSSAPRGEHASPTLGLVGWCRTKYGYRRLLRLCSGRICISHRSCSTTQIAVSILCLCMSDLPAIPSH